MDIRNDFILRAILMFVEMIRKMLGKESIEKDVLEQALNEACGIDLEKFNLSPAFIKQMVELSSSNDENKKALATACLYLKDQDRFGNVCKDLISSMKWTLLHSETKNLLIEIFNLDVSKFETDKKIQGSI